MLHSWLSSLPLREKRELIRENIGAFSRFGRKLLPPKDNSDREGIRFALESLHSIYVDFFSNLPRTPYKDVGRAVWRKLSAAFVKTISQVPGLFPSLVRNPKLRDILLDLFVNPNESRSNPAEGLLYRHAMNHEIRTELSRHPALIAAFDKDPWRGRQKFSEWMDARMDPGRYAAFMAYFRNKQLEQVEEHLHFVKGIQVPARKPKKN